MMNGNEVKDTHLHRNYWKMKTIILHNDLLDRWEKVLWAMIDGVKCYVLDGLDMKKKVLCESFDFYVIP